LGRIFVLQDGLDICAGERPFGKYFFHRHAEREVCHLGKAKNEKEKNRGGEEDVDDSDSLAALETHYVGKVR
jgi:hypothetical protein